MKTSLEYFSIIFYALINHWNSKKDINILYFLIIEVSAKIKGCCVSKFQKQGGRNISKFQKQGGALRPTRPPRSVRPWFNFSHEKFSFLFSLFFSAGWIALTTNQIDSASVDVQIIEGNLYSRDRKKAFTFRIARGLLRRGSKPAKFARWDRKVFSITGWSLRRGF